MRIIKRLAIAAGLVAAMAGTSLAQSVDLY
jgi:hypothetical protein